MFMFCLRFFLLTLGCVGYAMADTPSIGQFASELMEPVSVLNKFISTGSILVGVMCLFAAFFRYLQYRVNPLAQPIGSVIVLFILGLALLGLPFVHILFDLHPFPN